MLISWFDLSEGTTHPLHPSVIYVNLINHGTNEFVNFRLSSLDSSRSSLLCNFGPLDTCHCGIDFFYQKSTLVPSPAALLFQ